MVLAMAQWNKLEPAMAQWNKLEPALGNFWTPIQWLKNQRVLEANVEIKQYQITNR